jgi:hypothetical protein
MQGYLRECTTLLADKHYHHTTIQYEILD